MSRTEQPDVETVELDVEDPSRYLRREIEREKARTANVLARWLIFALVFSLPVHYLVAAAWPEASDAMSALFDRWLATIAPLAGAAVGFYYGRRSEDTQEPNHG